MRAEVFNESWPGAPVKASYLVLTYSCLAHPIAASAFLLPMRAAHVALALVT